MTTIETGYRRWNARTMYERICSSMTDMGRAWVKEQAKSVQEFPVLPNGQRGLQIGWGFGFVNVGRRKVLQPDGTLIWLTADYKCQNPCEVREYASKLTLDEVEKAVAQPNQSPSAEDEGGLHANGSTSTLAHTGFRSLTRRHPASYPPRCKAGAG